MDDQNSAWKFSVGLQYNITNSWYYRNVDKFKIVPHARILNFDDGTEFNYVPDDIL